MTPEEIAALAAEAAELDDQSVVTEGGGDYEYVPPAAGRTVARFIEYIELGKQPQKPFQGKAKPPVEEARFTFELTHPKNRKEIELEGGEKTTISERISFKLTIKTGEKSQFKKLWNAMTYGRDNIKHMAQMLGEAFIVEVVHAKSNDGKVTYANLRDNDGWKIMAPRKVDDLAGTSEDISKSIPSALGDLRIFLWNKPTKATWDSIFIDGTREVKDEKGNVSQESKNWLQTLVTKATNYTGSPLEQMLNNLGGLSIDKQDEKSGADAALAKLEEQKQPETTPEDDLASLGL